MRKLRDITNRQKDQREMESLYWLTDGPTDRLTDKLMEWLTEWSLWNAGSLKLEVSGSLTIRVWTDKRQEGAPYSTTGPLALCGFIKRNDNHISSTLLGWCALGWHSSQHSPSVCKCICWKWRPSHKCCLGLSTSNSDQGPKHLQCPLFEITFLSLCQWELKKTVLSAGQQSADLSLSSLLNHALKIALMFKQFTQTALWLTLYAQRLCTSETEDSVLSLLWSLWVRIQVSQLSSSSLFAIFPASMFPQYSKE